MASSTIAPPDKRIPSALVPLQHEPDLLAKLVVIGISPEEAIKLPRSTCERMLRSHNRIPPPSSDRESAIRFESKNVRQLQDPDARDDGYPSYDTNRNDETKSVENGSQSTPSNVMVDVEKMLMELDVIERRKLSLLAGLGKFRNESSNFASATREAMSIDIGQVERKCIALRICVSERVSRFLEYVHTQRTRQNACKSVIGAHTRQLWAATDLQTDHVIEKLLALCAASKITGT